MTTTTDTPIARPEVAAPGRWSFPEPVATSLPNGLDVLRYDVPGQYVIAVRLVIPLSTRAEPREKEGVATLMARLLDEGTDRHTTEEFTELLERKGAMFSAGLSDRGLHAELDVPARGLADALDLMHTAIAQPSFPQKQLSRLVRTRLAEIEQERASAPHRAARELSATYFDAEERASRPTAGTAETVRGLTREDVVAFHRTHVDPTNATLVLAGDFDDQDPMALVEATFGSWAPLPAPLTPQLSQARRAADAIRIVLVDRPGSVQSEIAVACPGPDRHVQPSWAAYQVLGFVVGGSPNARVDAVLREEKGYTYGLRSAFRPRGAGGLFVTSGSVRTEVTADALRVLLELLDTAREGFTEAECRDGVDFIRNTAPGRYATADAIADEAAGLVLDDLPLDFTTTTLDAMATLSPADLQAAYGQFVDGTWTIIVVGDAASYADDLRALERGEVSVVAN